MALLYNLEVHDEYNKLLQEYLDAKDWYEYEKSTENWDLLQEAIAALNRHNGRRDITR